MKQKRKKISTVWIKSLTNKCIPMLDPKQEMYKIKFQCGGPASRCIYIYTYIVLISSVGVQRHNVFIRSQKGMRTTIKTDIKSQNSRG